MVETAIPEPRGGEILLRNLWLGLDLAARTWINNIESHVPPVQIGKVMRGETVAEVIASNHPEVAVGSLVVGMFGW